MMPTLGFVPERDNDRLVRRSRKLSETQRPCPFRSKPELCYAASHKVDMPRLSVVQVASFSGGWQMRIGLGKILLAVRLSHRLSASRFSDGLVSKRGEALWIGILTSLA